MKHKVIGILAHVDAGKTTLIESLLYQTKTIRTMGRVDHKDTLLDFDSQERDRGITIYAKEAHFQWNDTHFYCIDTPGHVDFSSEMERSLQVLDLAILLINGQDGIQSHTETIFKCLEHYKIPTLIFVNKMDIAHYSKEELLNQLQETFSETCIDILDSQANELIALTQEDRLNYYLEHNDLLPIHKAQATLERQIFPVLFGSALKHLGILDLLNALDEYILDKDYPQDFMARVFKITIDDQNNRLTHIKITGGTLQTKQRIDNDEKVDQIRLYNGAKYEQIQEACAGMICTIKGLEHTYIGQGLGQEKDIEKPLLNAYLNYRLLLPEGTDTLKMMRFCQVLAQEDPQLSVSYDESSKQIHLQLMGEIQKEILQKKIEQKSGVHVEFGPGAIVYKETIENEVYGVGHYEPLRHYAEVYLKLEPANRNSGILIENQCTNDLSLTWQKQILQNLETKEHKGVLTGSLLTDIKITLLAGKGHTKHTEGQDFRQASARAVRQALKQAKSILLEPYFRFQLQIDHQYTSWFLFDLDKRQATIKVNEQNDGSIKITGTAPVRLMSDFAQIVLSQTKGSGRYSCQLDGYFPSLDQEQIIKEINYDSERDLDNPTGSIFCEKGAGYYVSWDEVFDHMHIDIKHEQNASSYKSVKHTISEEEAKRFFALAGGQNKKKDKPKPKPKPKVDLKMESAPVQKKKKPCLIVDGYNMIYSFKQLKDIQDLANARDTLIDLLMNYQGYKNISVILVFDAYRTKQAKASTYYYGNIQVIYTKHGVSADQYIESLVSQYKNTYDLRVATSDGLIQNAILASGAKRISARELELEISSINRKAMHALKELKERKM